MEFLVEECKPVILKGISKAKAVAHEKLTLRYVGVGSKLD